MTLSELKELAMKATQGDRVVTYHEAFRYHSANGARIKTVDGVCIASVTRTADKPIEQKKADAELIAAANPATVLAMIQLIEECRIALNAYKASGDGRIAREAIQSIENFGRKV